MFTLQHYRPKTIGGVHQTYSEVSHWMPLKVQWCFVDTPSRGQTSSSWLWCVVTVSSIVYKMWSTEQSGHHTLHRTTCTLSRHPKNKRMVHYVLWYVIRLPSWWYLLGGVVGHPFCILGYDLEGGWHAAVHSYWWSAQRPWWPQIQGHYVGVVLHCHEF